MIDYTKVRKKIIPDRDGEPHTHLRTGTVDAVNSNGTLDILMASGVIIPSVPKLAGAYAPDGAVVNIISFRGSLLVIGAVGVNSSAGPMARVATATPRTSNSGSFTAETVVDTVVAPLVTGRTYRITWAGAHFSTVADGSTRSRLREDNVSGTALQLAQQQTASQIVNNAYPTRMEAEYTAVSTGNKTFVATIARNTGTGSITAQASATNPTYFYVDYVRN